MQTQLPAALQQLIALGAKTSAPGPMGQPVPTVAAQQAMKADQQDVAKMAGIAGPTIAQNQQRAQLEQLAQRVAQLNAGNPAQQGIATLRSGGEVARFNGEFGNMVDVEAAVADELRVAEARRKREEAENARKAEFLRDAGAPQAAEYAKYLPKDVAPQSKEAPKKEESKFPVLPDPSTVNPAILKLVQSLMASGRGAPSQAAYPEAPIDKGLVQLASEEFNAPVPLLADQTAERKAARAAYGLKDLPGAGIEAIAQRMAESRRGLESAREKDKKGQALENFIAATAGARTGGLGSVGRNYAAIKNAQRKAEADFRVAQYEREMAENKLYMAAEEVKEAAASGDQTLLAKKMENWEAAKRDAARAKGMATAKLAELRTEAWGKREDRMAADRRSAAANNARTMAGIMRLLTPQKPNGPTPLEILKIDEAAETRFNPTNPSPDALQFLAKLPNGAQLVRDIANGNIKPGSAQWNAQVVPRVLEAREAYKRSILSQTKYGPPAAVPYSQAAAEADAED
jgi:hypothetical protein